MCNISFPGNGIELSEGTHSYPFAFQLKHLLPSSFRGTYGKIKYKLEFVVDKPWQFDEKYEVPLTIFRSLDLNYDPYARVPQQKQTTRNVGFIGSGPVSLHVHIPRTGVVPGELLPLQVIVSNFSSTEVDKVSFVLRKVIDYNSSALPRHTKQEIVQVLKKEAGGVEAKKDQRYEHQLLIPELASSDTDASGIINIHYEIQVEAKMHGMFNKDLIETIPLTVATIPLRDESIPATGSLPPVAPGTASYIPAMPMPMPMPSVLAMPAYPSPPQHIAQYPPSYPAAPHHHILAGDIPGLFGAPNASGAPQAPYPTYGTPQAPPRQHHGTSGASTPRMATAPPLDFTFASPNSTRSSVCSQQWDTPPTYDEVFGSPGHSMTSSHNSAAFDDSSSIASGVSDASSVVASGVRPSKHTVPTPVASFS